MNEYPELRRKCYDFGEGETAYFVPVCPICGRFVKADNTIFASLSKVDEKPNATCSKHGRVIMPFEGFY